MTNQNDAQAMMNCSMDSNFGINTAGLTSASFSWDSQSQNAENAANAATDFSQMNSASNNLSSGVNSGCIAGYVYPPTNLTGWGYWQNYYYPYIIRESYPIYIQEKAKDNAKQAYEIVKILKDKKLIHIEKVADFVEIMDELIKIL